MPAAWVSAAAGVVGALSSSDASSSAASNQASAANNAAQLQYQANQNALQQQNAQYQQANAQQAPYRDVGTAALGALSQYVGLGNTQGVNQSYANQAMPGSQTGTAAPGSAVSGQAPAYQSGPSASSAYQGTPQTPTVDLNAVDPSSGLTYSQEGFTQQNLPTQVASGVVPWGGPGSTAPDIVNRSPSAPTAAPAAAPAAAPQQTFNPASIGANQQAGPYNPTGGQGINSPGLAPFSLAQFQVDPGYQFALAQGNQAINNQAAARGLSLSPQTLQQLDQYNVGQAQQMYQTALQDYTQNQTNTFNRLADLAGIGQTSLAQTGNLGAQNANASSNLITGGANAQAAGIVGAANANTAGAQGMNTSLNNFLRGNTLGNLFGNKSANNSPAASSSVYGDPNAQSALGGFDTLAASSSVYGDPNAQSALGGFDTFGG